MDMVIIRMIAIFFTVLCIPIINFVKINEIKRSAITAIFELNLSLIPIKKNI